jgi:pimeloyl-ACP methyl ester carboxylesterase
VPVPEDEQIHTASLEGGRRLAYATYGDPAGAPVVYCHGGLSAHSDIAFADDRARQLGVRLLAVDRPGIGESSRAGGRSVADWAGDVGELTLQIGVDQFAVLGWSAGGPFALACAAGLPDRVTVTATVGGMAPLDDTHRAKDLGLAMDRLLFPLSRRAPSLAALLLSVSKVMPNKALQRQLLRALPASDRAVVAAMTPAEVTQDLRVAMRHGPRGVVDDYVVTGGDWHFRPEDVAGPVAMFQGDEDVLLPMAHAESLAGRLPAGRLEVVAGAGHFLLHTHLERVLAALTG